MGIVFILNEKVFRFIIGDKFKFRKGLKD